MPKRFDKRRARQVNQQRMGVSPGGLLSDRDKGYHHLDALLTEVTDG